MDWLPDALKDYHQRSFPWQGDAPPRGILHTTEGSGWPSYSGWTIMPHATIMPTPGKGITIRQHLPFSQGSFALVHAAGQVATNGLHAYQFELIGTCDKGGPGYYWPDADDAVLADLYRKVVKPLDDAFRIPLRAATFLLYPASYGPTSARMTPAQWTAFSGWAGHSSVPENDHGDPGAFPWDRMVRLAAGQETDMTPDECRQVVRDELKAALGPVAEAVWGAKNPQNTAWGFLMAAAGKTFPTADQVAAAVKAALPPATGGAAAPLDDATLARIAKAVWDEGATRLVR